MINEPSQESCSLPRSPVEDKAPPPSPVYVSTSMEDDKDSEQEKLLPHIIPTPTIIRDKIENCSEIKKKSSLSLPVEPISTNGMMMPERSGRKLSVQGLINFAERRKSSSTIFSDMRKMSISNLDSLRSPGIATPGGVPSRSRPSSKMTKYVECWGADKPFANITDSKMAKNIGLAVSTQHSVFRISNNNNLSLINTFLEHCND